MACGTNKGILCFADVLLLSQRLMIKSNYNSGNDQSPNSSSFHFNLRTDAYGLCASLFDVLHRDNDTICRQIGPLQH